MAPTGPIYQAGTLSGNPLAVSAGLAVVRRLMSEPGLYDQIEIRAARLTADPPRGTTVNRVGSMFTLFFTENPVTDYESAKTCDTERFARFHRGMLEEGIYLAPSQFEAGFVSTAHSDEDIASTASAVRRVAASL